MILDPTRPLTPAQRAFEARVPTYLEIKQKADELLKLVQTASESESGPMESPLIEIEQALIALDCEIECFLEDGQ